MGNVYVLAVVLSVSWHTTLLGTKMGFIQHGTSTEGKERWSTWQGNGDFAPDHNKRHCDITHQSHSEDQCVEIKDFFLTLLWCPLDCTNINFCCWYTYSVILSDAILFNLLLTPVHFFFTNLSLCSFNISFIFAFLLLPPHILCLFDCACTCLSITECRFCSNVLNVLQAEREHLYLGKRRSSYTVRESYCHERLWSYK